MMWFVGIMCFIVGGWIGLAVGAVLSMNGDDDNG